MGLSSSWRSGRRARGPTASWRDASGSIGVPSAYDAAMSTPVGGQREVERLGGGAHREEESAPLDELARSPRPRPASPPARWEAELPGHGAVALHHVHQPGSAGVVQEELGVLAGEVLVVQMQPVVGLELAAEDLRVPDLLELDPGVVERHGDGVVPGRGVGRRVHRHLGRLLQRHRVHVAALRSRPGSGPARRRPAARSEMPPARHRVVVAASAGSRNEPPR